MHWVSSVPLGITISILGLVGNALSVYVWFRLLKKRIDSSSSTSIYLIALGTVDCLLLFFFILTNAMPSAIPSITTNYAYAVFYSYIGFPFLYFFIVSSIWLLVGVTVSRYVIVKVPLKAKALCSPLRTVGSIGIILIMSFIVNIPHFFNYSPGSVNGTSTIIETAFAKTGGSAQYEFWIHCMFLVLVPWFGILALNGCIIWSMKQRAEISSNIFAGAEGKRQERVKQQHQITRMLLFVTFSFIFLLGWQCVSQCLWMVGYTTQDSNWDTVDQSFAVAKLGIVINSSINWLLYCVTGSAFRKEVLKLYHSHASVVSPDQTTESSEKSVKQTFTLSSGKKESSI